MTNITISSRKELALLLRFYKRMSLSKSIWEDFQKMRDWSIENLATFVFHVFEELSSQDPICGINNKTGVKLSKTDTWHF